MLRESFLVVLGGPCVVPKIEPGQLCARLSLMYYLTSLRHTVLAAKDKNFVRGKLRINQT